MKKLAIIFSATIAFPTMATPKSDYYTLNNEFKIVKLKDFMKESLKDDKDAEMMKVIIAQFKKMHEDMENKGYVLESHTKAQYLLNKANAVKFKKSIDIKDKEIKDSLYELPLSYDYKPIFSNVYTAHIGFAPMGVYRKVEDGFPKEGWTGIVELFVKDKLSCSYSEHNTTLAHGGNELIEEFLTYKIHDKPTIELVKGAPSSGFVYEVKWYEKGFDKQLECADLIFSKDTMGQVISIANDIDNK